MTRTLVLLRHAKAEAPAGRSDKDRPLTARGHADAGAAGAWLAARGLKPDLVLCSPARRARETWHGVQVVLGKPPKVEFDPEMYGSGPEEMLALIRATEPSVSTLLLVGHDPTISAISALLDPDGDDDDGLRTAGLAVHELAGSWADCGPGQAKRTAAHTARA